MYSEVVEEGEEKVWMSQELNQVLCELGYRRWVETALSTR
jgi:hypothetical protein